MQNNKIKNKDRTKEKKSLQYFFENFAQEKAIIQALREGYTQSEIATFLKLPVGLISKISKNFLQKQNLFERLKKAGVFWSYAQNLGCEDVSEHVFIEQTLKYADFDDIKELIALFGPKKVKKVWEANMKGDRRFRKINLLIARVFLDLDLDLEELKKAKNARLEKFKFLASSNKRSFA